MADQPSKSANMEDPTLTIHDLGWEGDGVARTEDGRVVFIAGVLPSDRVQVKLGEATGRGPLRGKLLQIVEPSPDRVPHPCAHASEGCPASPLGAWKPEAAAAWKQHHLGQTLRRIGGISDVEIDPIVPSPSAWNYRDRIELNVETASEGLALGYRGEEGRLVPVQGCMLGSELLSRALVRLSGSTWSGEKVEGQLRLLLRQNGEGGVVAVLFATDLRTSLDPEPWGEWLDGAALAGWQIRTASTVAARYFRSQVVAEKGNVLVAVPVGEDFIALPPVAFSQANGAGARELIRVVLEQIAPTEFIADLYGGFGAFALEHAVRGGHAEVFESNPDAVHAGQEYAKSHDLPVLYRLVDLEKQAGQELSRFSVAIVDPPRSGLSRQLIEALNRRGPKRLLYISCHPAALARDCVRLSDYKLLRCSPVDMFPGTPDLETVALLERS